MSDFYRHKRLIIKDVAGLSFFLLAFAWAGAFVWPLMGRQVNLGEMSLGLAYLLGAIFGIASVAGVVGLLIGSVLGGTWERWHRSRRPRKTEPSAAPVPSHETPYSPAYTTSIRPSIFLYQASDGDDRLTGIAVGTLEQAREVVLDHLAEVSSSRSTTVAFRKVTLRPAEVDAHIEDPIKSEEWEPSRWAGRVATRLYGGYWEAT